MKYPDNERILIVRPCLKAICLGVRSASKLLSVMLYRARNVPEQETLFTFTCTQADLVHDLCEELTTKQIHDMAIPVLQLLGYLDVNGSGFRHTYTIHLDKVQAALSFYKNSKKLELLLISFIRKQLEEVPNDLELVPNQLEEVLIQLEKLLIVIRTSSNSKRGRKPKQEAALEGNFASTQIKRESITDITEKRESHARAPSENENHSHDNPMDDWNCHNWRMAHGGLEVASCEEYQAWIDSGGRDVPTDKFPAIASTPGEAASPPVALSRQSQTTSSLSEPDGAASGGNVTRPRASDEQTTPVSLTAASATSPPAQMAAGAVTWESILADWEAVQGRPQSRTDRMRKAAREGVVANPTREELRGCRDWLPTTDNPNKPYYRKKGVGLWDVIDRMDEYRSHLALSIEPAPLADMPKPKPMDVYTANSLDKEKMKRRADEMIANVRAKGLTLHDGTQP